MSIAQTLQSLANTSTAQLRSQVLPLFAEHPALEAYIERLQQREEHRSQMLRQTLSLLARRHVAVIDLEATCYETEQERTAYAQEIIEVGWALLDMRAGKVVARRQFYVKPTTSPVSAFCTRLTGIEPHTVANAPAYAAVLTALARLHENVPETQAPVHAWVSYGRNDAAMFERQCKAEGLANPMVALEHMNIKPLVGVRLGTGKQRPGMARAMARAGLELQGRHHSGADDAFNIARLVAWALSLGEER